MSVLLIFTVVRIAFKLDSLIKTAQKEGWGKNEWQAYLRHNFFSISGLIDSTSELIAMLLGLF